MPPLFSFDRLWYDDTMKNFRKDGSMLTKNQLIEIEITDLTSEGNGVGHVGEERFAIFVPNTAPGDRAQIRVVKVLKN